MMPELACHKETYADYEYAPNASGEPHAEATYGRQSNENKDTDIKFCHCWVLIGIAPYKMFKKGISFKVNPKVCLIASSVGIPVLN